MYPRRFTAGRRLCTLSAVPSRGVQLRTPIWISLT